ncbi:GGDEF domain-containing protein [Pseudomonas sp. GOM7]|uniref:GGDEF domain-containing protein n=1 Tax=Pseudomonas sp. GOM7 TaxID=2998079 RepID=UPI00227D4327|nr:GGDEF domain-containing protein [Pseudomonas sp. GOM7]WAJ36460.1 GGDEF domain-containing protein [Pseudomonas sp. GOM7]
MPLSYSLRSRFALVIALLVGALSWMLGTLIGQYSSQQFREDTGRNLAELSYSMADRLDRDMASRAAVLRVLGSLQALRQPDDLGEVRQLLDNLQKEIPSIAWIGFVDPQGTVLASSNGLLEGASVAQRPVFLEAQKNIFIGDVHEAVLLAKLLSNPSGEAMKFVDISLPIKGSNGELVGILASHLSWAWAYEVRRSLLEPIQERRNVEFFVIGKEGSILLGPREMLGHPLELPKLADLQPGSSQWAVQRWPDGNEYLTGMTRSQGYQDYPGLGWTVVARQSVEQAYAPAQRMLLNILIWGSALALAFAFFGWLISGYFTRPLQEIAEAADRLSAGEVSEIPEMQGSREITQLSQSIRHLVESLTLQKRALGAMETLAHHDPLTGLPNRVALEKYLPRAQHRCQAQQQCLTLLYLDLDDFKPINDTYGHSAGDHLLRELAQRLKSNLRDGDMVARLGGDEFLMIMLVNEADARQQARQVAERAIASLGQPVQLEEGQVRIGCSIGGAIWPLDHADLGEALELADQALYRAKQEGRNRAQFQDGAITIS